MYHIIACKEMSWFWLQMINFDVQENMWVLGLDVWRFLFADFFLMCGGCKPSLLHGQDICGWGSIPLGKLSFKLSSE